MSIATITLYGANTDVASNPIVATTTDVEALSGVDSVEFEVDWIDPQPTNEGSITSYLNSYQFALNSFRIKYNLLTEWQDFPSTDTDFVTYQPFITVINNKFHWVDFGDYKLNMYSGQDGTNCLRVNIEDYSLISEGGKKYWNITLSELKQNMART